MSKSKKISEHEQSFNEDRNAVVKSIFLYISGSGLLVFIVAGGLWVSNYSWNAIIPPSNEVSKLVNFIGFVCQSIAILFILSITVLIFDFLVPKWTIKQAERLQDVVDRLIGKDENDKNAVLPKISELNDKLHGFSQNIIPAFLGEDELLTKDLKSKGIINSLISVIQKLNILDQQIVFYKNDPSETYRDFLLDKEMLEADLKYLRLAGTMMGVTGEGQFCLSKNITTLTIERIKAKKTTHPEPFKECIIVLPGCPHKDSDEKFKQLEENHNSSYDKYCIYGRFFALQVLRDLREAMGNNISYDQIKISLKFTDGIDFFPAWQLWDEQRFLMLCSVGPTDRMNRTDSPKNAIADALPIAIGAKMTFTRDLFGSKKELYNISDTITRIKNHFDIDLCKKYDKDSFCEEWILKNDNLIYVNKLQMNAGGIKLEGEIMNELGENKKIWNNLYEKYTLNSDEETLIYELFKKIISDEDRQLQK